MSVTRLKKWPKPIEKREPAASAATSQAADGSKGKGGKAKAKGGAKE